MMTTITSKHAQNRFGELLDTAQREPVVITRRDRPVAVVVSRERYDMLEALEDAVWAARAEAAAARGFAGEDETRVLFREVLGPDADAPPDI